MAKNHIDLPLSNDPAVRLLPWIVGLMVYLATMTLAGGLLVAALAAEWSAGLTGTVTIHIVAADDTAAADLDAQVEQAVRLALKTPGVVSAEPMPQEKVAALLAPWLGATAGIADLPLPRIIDVGINEDETDVAALKSRVEAEIAGAGLDDHQLWRDRLVTFLRVMELIAIVMVMLIGITTVSVVVFATRSGLAVHSDAIEILHLVGAYDEYIAGQFQSQALALGLKGGAAGSVAGLISLLGLAFAASNLDSELLPFFLFQPWHWPILVSLPLAAALIVRQTAKRTVLRALRRML
ncbi:MAG: cell division protein [Proteobacteria bacterium]|nr:cell division protein [Pseudomonadota bacterium]